ncbi:hypothetical protein SDJN02_12685 [Cucurbita argyrosperma subsp. argyrosperma]|nr:hypothetical protein SDJN02_12685 [Cucurbita argyrosperma subsp. argyrosperma]
MAAGIPLRLAGKSPRRRGATRRQRVHPHSGSGERADGGGDEHRVVVSGSGVSSGEGGHLPVGRRRVSGDALCIKRNFSTISERMISMKTNPGLPSRLSGVEWMG